MMRSGQHVSQAASATARAILDLREQHRQAIAQRMGGSTNGLILLDYLFEQPILSVRLVEQHLRCAYVTANKLVDQFVELSLLREITGWQRNRRNRYEPYRAFFGQSGPMAVAVPPDDAAIQTTGSEDGHE